MVALGKLITPPPPPPPSSKREPGSWRPDAGFIAGEAPLKEVTRCVATTHPCPSYSAASQHLDRSLAGWRWWIRRGGMFNLSHVLKLSYPRNMDRGCTQSLTEVVLAPHQEAGPGGQAPSGCLPGRSTCKGTCWAQRDSGLKNAGGVGLRVGRSE